VTGERREGDADAPLDTEPDVVGADQPLDDEAAGEANARADGEGDDEANGTPPADPGRTHRPGRRRRRVRLLAVVTITIGVLLAVTCWMFVWPPTDTPAHADVVLVLAGGRGERETTGARLVQEGVAPVIVFSDGGVPDSSSGRLCRQRFPGIQVVCLHAEAGSTRGEAQAFAELAAQEGWRSVAVVTSSYHVRRASLLVDRCFDGTVHPVAAGLGPSRGVQLVRSVLREASGFLIASTTVRGC
jgi:uncharacterized SAM-binding protein YcdF (DUF218 family)